MLEGRGHTEVNGKRLEWQKIDILMVPDNMWRRHVNAAPSADAVPYSLTDEPLLKTIGQYRAQCRDRSDEVVELAG